MMTILCISMHIDTIAVAINYLQRQRDKTKHEPIILEQDAQLSQRDRAAGYTSFGRKWKTGTQRQYFTDIVSLASTTVT